MLDFGHYKHYRSFVFRPILIILFVVLCEHACVLAGSTPPQQSFAHVAGETPATALTVESICEQILSGDFVGAREILNESTGFDSTALGQLRTVIDEYMAIEARRKASQNDAYREQRSELERLRQEDCPKDSNEVGRVLAVASKVLECSNKEQKQALLNDILVVQAVRQAKDIAAEFELKGKWLDAYKVCYGKLEQIYEDDSACSDYAKELLIKADILAFLQDSRCESCRERYAGIEKEMFINAVDILDSSYINIIDYRGMAIEAINRCKCLAEVMSNSHLEMKYKIRNTQYELLSEALNAILDEVHQSTVAMDKNKLIDFFERVVALSESPFVRLELPQELLITQFAKGALSSLDPYTVIYWPSQAKNFEKKLTRKFTGIGIRFSKREELARVISVLPDTPAYYSGFEAGDVIMAIDGVATNEMSADCVAQSIAGPEGTKVTLTIKRQGEYQDRDITVHRANITVPSIHGWQRTGTGEWRFMIDGSNKIGYVRISSFCSETADDFEQTLVQLEAQGLKGLILDLRSNPGGLVKSAVEIADRFIREGLIVRVQPRFGMPTYISANEGKTHPDYPIVVLIDRSTASASEILAGVLQEPKYKRATVIGERSYGKGSVQSIVNNLGGGAKLKYTTAYYYLPSGQNIKSRDMAIKQGSDDWGITPNIPVRLRIDELRKTADVQKANELVAKDHLNNSPDIQRFSSRETIDADPQLAIGLLVLKSKMIESGLN